MKFKYSSLLVSGLALATFAATTVSADDTGLTNGGQLTITKDFNLTDGVLSPNATFTFSVKGDDHATGDKDGLHVYSGTNFLPTQQSATVNYTNSSTANSTTDGKTKTATVDFTTATYTKPGIYRYQVTELQEKVPGVTYDTKTYTVDVYVLSKDDGTYTPQYIVSHEKDQTDKKPVKFDNTIKTTSLTVSKKVTGNAGDKNKEFTFSINLHSKDGENYYNAGNVTMTITRKDQKTETISVPVTNTPTTFKLKDGESATIDKLPEGILYSVAETPDDGYTQTATVQKDTSKDTTEEYPLGDSIESDGTADKIVVTNTKNSTTPTGVAMTIAPYVGLTILALGGVVYVYKKRKA